MEGEEPAISRGEGDRVTWAVSWQLGLSGSSHQSYPLWVHTVTVGLFLPGQGCSATSLLRSVTSEAEVVVVVCGEVGWQPSHKVSRHSWFGNSAMESGMLASLVCLVLGLWPRAMMSG